MGLIFAALSRRPPGLGVLEHQVREQGRLPRARLPDDVEMLPSILSRDGAQRPCGRMPAVSAAEEIERVTCGAQKLGSVP